jgi:polyhydroxyalkanoate synthesis regulator phasin
MTDMEKWESGKTLTPEEEPEYLKDFCAYLREQQTLSPVRKEGESQVCDIVPDEMAAHAADIIEELLGRIEKLEYELRELKA